MGSVWEQKYDLQVARSITGGFDIGFEAGIPEETKDALMDFVYWVEDHYDLPVTLWVDFKRRHYLYTREKKRVGYLFYWADFANYPVFENEDDIPVIELPVRTEKSSIEEILLSFIEGITCYYAWLGNRISHGFTPDETETEGILQKYLQSKDR